MSNFEGMDKVWSILLLLLLCSCKNELNVNLDNDGLPVTYCVLDVDDTVQQLRLAKSFFPESGELQQDHMTIKRWEEPVEIYIEEWKDNDHPAVYDFYPADTIRQDTGFFNNPSFSLYQTAFKPLPNTLYYIYLIFPERNYFSFASTVTVDHTEILNPAAIPGRKVTFSDLDDFIVELRPPPNAEFHQFSFLLTVEEYLSTGFNLDYFNFGGQVYEENRGQILNHLLNSDRFYLDLIDRYDELSGDEYRRITGLEFVVYSYGTELRLYNRLYNNGAQPWEIQSYSSFKNGFGLFSSKSKSRTANLEFSNLTWDLLTGDSRYKPLKFIK